jgi:hypothetical protein
MTISDLLLSQHRWDGTRCRRFLASIPMSETKTVGSMTDRQRRALALSLLGDRLYSAPNCPGALCTRPGSRADSDTCIA